LSSSLSRALDSHCSCISCPIVQLLASTTYDHLYN
jgi:hypothetical protein